MPSFDIVSEVDAHEIANAVDQSNREIATRYDFKGSDARIEHTEQEIRLEADSEFQLDQMRDILFKKLARRGVDIKAMDAQPPVTRGQRAHQPVHIQQGIDKDQARGLIRAVKDSRIRVQASIQGDQVRVTGKKRDDLQAVIQLIRETDLGLPLQFTNFRD